MARYAAHVSKKKTPQSEAIPGKKQVRNSNAGFSFAVDDWARLDRFLVLGCEGGSYYAAERPLTQENAQAVIRCIAADGAEVVRRIVAVSTLGRAPKNDAAIFCLALAASVGSAETKQAALAALDQVCRTGTHLFQFAAAVEELRGWGRGLRRAVASWYTCKDPRDLAYQVTKYQQREGWSHRDLLRLSHPCASTETDTGRVLHWVVKGWPGVGEQPHDREALLPIWAAERVKRAATETEVIDLIRGYGLVREVIPTQWLTSPAVWDALLERMPLTAMIRNLATMTRVGLLAPLAEATKRVVSVLTDADKLRASRVHPIAVLAALMTYQAGRGERGKHTWEPVTAIVDALDAAFYKAFKNVEPTNKRWLLALDVSGSMTGGTVAGVPGLTPRVASAALALVTAAVEREHMFVAFTNGTGPSLHSASGYGSGITPLAITPRQRLDTVLKKVDGLAFGGTDCALPMLYAAQKKLSIDAFVVLTDSETWAGNIHPCQALEQYRQKMGIPAKLIVVGMVSNGFTIADPNDAGMLDVVGFDLATPQLMADFVKTEPAK
jgi:60 kDa SS-A/Ro ribonucleoprotein